MKIWGNTDQTAGIPEEITDAVNSGNEIVQVAAGGNHNIALMKSGEIYAWGRNYKGQCDIPNGTELAIASDPNAGNQHFHAMTGLSDIVYIDAGEDTSIALKADGTIY